jgi:hypothetical protein
MMSHVTQYAYDDDNKNVDLMKTTAAEATSASALTTSTICVS